MHILLIGSASGRLSCLADAMRQGNQATLDILTNYENPTLSALGSVYVGNPADPEWIAEHVRRNVRVVADTIAVISNEEPLATGVVDRLHKLGIATMGPPEALAKIETSKIFARELLDRHDIPGNPLWRAFGPDTAHAISHIDVWMETLGDFVIKPDGLTGGKGVQVMGDHFRSRSQGLAICLKLLKDGQSFIIEEKIDGLEFSFISISDGITIVDTFPVCDCKRLLDGDLGPNTGGMGSTGASHVLPSWLTDVHVALASTTNRMVIEALQRETGQPYRGVLYGNFIVCREGVKLIEYNARFGDPEIMNILPLLETNLADIAWATARGTLTPDMVKFRPGFTVVKYLVPNGHPTNPVPDVPVHTDGISFNNGLRLYKGSLIRVARGDVTTYCTTGSRALALVGVADTMEEAERIAEKAAQEVPGALFHRKDIGTAAFFQARQKRFNAIMGH